MRRMAEAKNADEIKHRLGQISKMETTIGDLKQKFRPLEDRNHLLEKEYNQLQNSVRQLSFFGRQAFSLHIMYPTPDKERRGPLRERETTPRRRIQKRSGHVSTPGEFGLEDT